MLYNFHSCIVFFWKIPRNYVSVNNKKRTYKARSTADLESSGEAVKAGIS